MSKCPKNCATHAQVKKVMHGKYLARGNESNVPGLTELAVRCERFACWIYGNCWSMFFSPSLLFHLHISCCTCTVW